jgi:hypothetical protein
LHVAWSLELWFIFAYWCHLFTLIFHTFMQLINLNQSQIKFYTHTKIKKI